MSIEDPPLTTKKRAKEIKKRCMSTPAAQSLFGPLFNAGMEDWRQNNAYFDDCSERFTVVDTEKLLELACEMELDQCDGFEEAFFYQCAPVHAMNALLLLVSSDRSLADMVAEKFVRLAGATIGSMHGDCTYFVRKILESSVKALLCECGPAAVPHLITEMRRLLLSPYLPESSFLGVSGASYIGYAMVCIIHECYLITSDSPIAFYSPTCQSKILL